MSTQAELLVAHRKELDAAYARRYPSGRFTLQVFHGTHLHWAPRRNTSHVVKRGVSTYLHDTGMLEQGDYQNCAFGRTYNYDSLAKLLKACKRHNVPKHLLDAFLDRYTNFYYLETAR